MHANLTLRTAFILSALLTAVTVFSLETQVIPAADLRKRIPMTDLFHHRASFNPPVHTPDFLFTDMDDGSNICQWAGQGRKTMASGASCGHTWPPDNRTER
jgi:hypothetical protein